MVARTQRTILSNFEYIFIFLLHQLRCIAEIHDVYIQKTEKASELDRPKPSASASNSINLVQQTPYDQFGTADGEYIEKKDTIMTHIQSEFTLFLLNIKFEENHLQFLNLILVTKVPTCSLCRK